MTDVVMVLGMHRSGTSALAGTLARLGCAMPATSMPANAGNPRGYFESKELMALNDQILASAGSSWRDWRPFDPDWYQSATAATFKRRAKDVFAAEYGGANLAVLKDPRICRFAPFWLSVLRDIDARTRVVIPVRSPLEVCRSLKREHGLPIGLGALLWLRHVLDAEAQSRPEIRSIFEWHHFQADWRSVIAKISADTGLSWPERANTAAPAIDEYVARKQPPHAASGDVVTVDPALHEWIALAYDALQELSLNPHSSAACDTLDQVRALLDQSTRVFRGVFAEYEATHTAVAAKLAQCLRENQRLANDLDLMSAQLTTLLAPI
jgi:hypothetical protein